LGEGFLRRRASGYEAQHKCSDQFFHGIDSLELPDVYVVDA
jgi:hypothetical protein